MITKRNNIDRIFCELFVNKKLVSSLMEDRYTCFASLKRSIQDGKPYKFKGHIRKYCKLSDWYIARIVGRLAQEGLMVRNATYSAKDKVITFSGIKREPEFFISLCLYRYFYKDQYELYHAYKRYLKLAKKGVTFSQCLFYQKSLHRFCNIHDFVPDSKGKHKQRALGFLLGTKKYLAEGGIPSVYGHGANICAYSNSLRGKPEQEDEDYRAYVRLYGRVAAANYFRNSLKTKANEILNPKWAPLVLGLEKITHESVNSLLKE